MLRRVLVSMSVLSVLVLAGCVGDTDPATHIQANQAQLNSHGHTNNGPAYWWWEYGTSRSAVTNGQGTKTPRQGPGAVPRDVPLSSVLKQLDPDQDYYYRACGQDQKAGSKAACGTVLSFRTSGGNAAVVLVPAGTGYATGIYVGAANSPSNAHFQVWDEYQYHSGFRVTESIGSNPASGNTIAPGKGCKPAYQATGPYDNDVQCTTPDTIEGLVIGYFGNKDDTPSGYDFFQVEFHGGPGNDTMDGSSSGPDTLYGDDGNDKLYGNGGNDSIYGGKGNDTIHGDAGADSIYGGDGDDVIYGGPGSDNFDCGAGNDVLHVENYNEWGYQSTGCESYVIDDD